MKKVLVAYFSASGVTKKVANKIAKLTSGDLFEIVPEKLYTAEDLDWRNPNSRSSLEMKDKSSRPLIKSKLDNIHYYDVIFLGFPIWWYQAPTIINTFLESYNFDDKIIVPFATSGSTGLENVNRHLKVSAPKAIFMQGFLLNHKTDNDIKELVNSLKF